MDGPACPGQDEGVQLSLEAGRCVAVQQGHVCTLVLTHSSSPQRVNPLVTGSKPL